MIERKSRFIHALVAEAFIPKVEGKDMVLHKVGLMNGGDNSVDNLYWGDAKDNALDREREKTERLEARIAVLEGR